jgi:hypothetical protein
MSNIMDISNATLIIISLYALIVGYFAYLFVWAMLERGEDRKAELAKANGNFWTDGGRHGRPVNSLGADSVHTHDGSRYVPNHGSPAFRP